MEKHPLHLKSPELQTSPEVQKAVSRQERRTGDRVANDPAKRIEAYTGRLENIFLNPDKRVRERNLELFRRRIYDALLIERENFPESYFALQKRVARERGQAVEEIPANVREQMKDVAIEDQKHSLDAWIDYLSSEDAVYPAWFKYFVWRNVTKLSQFDKARGEFKKRTESTVAPFPDIYREPLAQIADIYEKVKTDNKNLKDAEIREAFSKKFPALYAELIQKSLAASLENREEVQGQWVKYERGDRTAAERLFASLEGKGTGWCTAGRSTAYTQITSGDFYVYYTNDASGTPAQPRLAIRMDGSDRIGEVRGILPHQGVEPVMQEVLDTKLGEFGTEADAYRKKSKDMRLLTVLEAKYEQGQGLTKDDLLFLYEINAPIEGFGYKKDPRIAELRGQRNTNEDMLVVFECSDSQIARSSDQINESTKAYVGKLEPGIFDHLPEGIEHVYTKFPEGRIRRRSIEIGGKTTEELKTLITTQGHKFDPNSFAQRMMDSEDFQRSIRIEDPEEPDYKKWKLKPREEIKLVRLTVADLGFPNGATTQQIFNRATELGLDLCPPEVGPYYRLQYIDQPMGEWVRIGMKPIAASDGIERVFRLGPDGVESWLRSYWARPDDLWDAGRQFVFSLRKSDT